MPLDPLQLKKSTDEILAVFPGAETFIQSTIETFTESVRQVASNATSALADAVTQIVAIGLSLDGAEIHMTIDPITVSVPPVTARWKVSMPLKPISSPEENKQ